MGPAVNELLGKYPISTAPLVRLLISLIHISARIESEAGLEEKVAISEFIRFGRGWLALEQALELVLELGQEQAQAQVPEPEQAGQRG